MGLYKDKRVVKRILTTLALSTLLLLLLLHLQLCLLLFLDRDINAKFFSQLYCCTNSKGTEGCDYSIVPTIAALPLHLQSVSP